MKNIYLIIGKSGSGKTTIVSELEKRGFTFVKSYTTRQKRVGDTSHIFMTQEEFDNISDTIVAFNIFDGESYCATRQQVDTDDMYVIDPDGVNSFMSLYHGKKGVRTIYIYSPKWQRKERMSGRGDSEITVERRLAHDEENGFNEIKTDFAVQNQGNLDIAVDSILQYIVSEEIGE